MKGDEIKRFVLAAPAICELLEASFEDDALVLSIVKALRLWYDIERFLKVGNIKLEAKDKNLPVPILILKFEQNITEFYHVGSTSFMKRKLVGDSETYYLHCLRFYISKLARQTWERHECGIGIYSMQGFERRNKESKSIMNKFNNNKQHRIPQQLRRLWDIFYRPRKRTGRKRQKVATTMAMTVAMTMIEEGIQAIVDLFETWSNKLQYSMPIDMNYYLTKVTTFE